MKLYNLFLSRHICTLVKSILIFSSLLAGISIQQWLHLRWILPCYKKSCCDVPQHTSLASTEPYYYQKSRKLLFIGALTAQKYLHSRVLTLNNTWLHSVSNSFGDIHFYSSEGSQDLLDIFVHGLSGIDDTYPPQNKSFHMLLHMFTNYINDYEWFMRADDDVFIKGDKLVAFLSSLNSSKPLLLGQAGQGKKEEFGQLFLENDENFCMGGPGVLISHAALKLIASKALSCLSNLLTKHEDVELTRCFRRHLNLQCTWSFDMQQLFYQNYDDEQGAFMHKRLDSAEVTQSLTLHPIKDHRHQYRIYAHNIIYMIGRSLNRLKRLEQTLDHQKIISKARTKSLENMQFFKRILYTGSITSSKRSIGTSWRHALHRVIQHAMVSMNSKSRERGRTVEYRDIYYGYLNSNFNDGATFVIDLFLNYRRHKGQKISVLVRRHAYLHQRYIGYFSSANRYARSESLHPYSEKATVNFILPLFSRTEVFRRFMRNFEEEFLITMEAVTLLVVLFMGPEQRNVYSIVARIQRKYPKSEIRVLEVGQPFSRALGLNLGSQEFRPDDLLFFIDVDIYFTRRVLTQARRNTVKGAQIYFPIVFSQYDSALICGAEQPCNHNIISNRTGYWRQFGYGISSLFKSDLARVGGLDTSLTGWGKEDVLLFNSFLAFNYSLFRSAEPSLVHVYHKIVCNSSLDPSRYDMCLGSKAASLAPTDVLLQNILNTKLLRTRIF